MNVTSILSVYRDAPQYADGREAIGSAEEAEVEYQRRIAPHLFVRACHPLIMVEPSVFVGETTSFERQDWSRVILVRYRSRRDFMEFILSPAFAQDADHKWAALSRNTSLAAVGSGPRYDSMLRRRPGIRTS